MPWVREWACWPDALDQDWQGLVKRAYSLCSSSRPFIVTDMSSMTTVGKYLKVVIP